MLSDKDIQKAINHPGFSWMPGMELIIDGHKHRIVDVRPGDLIYPGAIVGISFEADPDRDPWLIHDREAGWVYDWGWMDDEGVSIETSSAPIPNPEDPATAGCLLSLLGPGTDYDFWLVALDLKPLHTIKKGEIRDETGNDEVIGSTLGEACFKAALILKQWPGGEDNAHKSTS